MTVNPLHNTPVVPVAGIWPWHISLGLALHVEALATTPFLCCEDRVLKTPLICEYREDGGVPLWWGYSSGSCRLLRLWHVLIGRQLPQRPPLNTGKYLKYPISNLFQYPQFFCQYPDFTVLQIVTWPVDSNLLPGSRLFWYSFLPFSYVSDSKAMILKYTLHLKLLLDIHQ
jgi:hypothetical protein